MVWEEVRMQYPNQFVLFKILRSHEAENHYFVDELEVIRPVPDKREATHLLVHSRGDTLVYHTSHDQIVLGIVRQHGLRRRFP